MLTTAQLTTALAAFVASLNGHFVDVDHAYGAQCADLANDYAEQVLKVPAFVGGGAVDFWTTYDHRYYAATPNTETNAPKAGDVVIWAQNAKAGTGPYGHVAIALAGATPQSFQGFSQNWPEGSPCHVVSFEYDGVLGFLTPITVPAAAPALPATTPPPATAADAVKVALRHFEALDAAPSVAGTNQLLAALRDKWPASYAK